MFCSCMKLHFYFDFVYKIVTDGLCASLPMFKNKNFLIYLICILARACFVCHKYLIKLLPSFDLFYVLVPVVQKVDNFTHQTSRYPDKMYWLECTLSAG